MKLNRKYKVGIFLVLIAAGLSLVWEASLKQTVGIVLLGAAATWLLGSVSGRVLWLVSSVTACVAGVLIAVPPTLGEYQNFHSSVLNCDHALSDLREALTNSIDQNKKESESLVRKHFGSEINFAKFAIADQEAYLNYAELEQRLTTEPDPVTEFKNKNPTIAGGDRGKIIEYLSDPKNFRAAFPDVDSETFAEFLERTSFDYDPGTRQWSERHSLLPGYLDDQLLDYLVRMRTLGHDINAGRNARFGVDAALKAGYSKPELIAYLMVRKDTQPANPSGLSFYDVSAARKAGVSDDAIIQYLADTRKFDLQTALNKGASTAGLIELLSSKPPSAPAVHLEIRMPESVENWKRPTVVGQNLSFPPDVTIQELMASLQSQLLQPRPKFSIVADVRAHRLTSFAGLALLIAGTFSLACFIRAKGDGRPKSVHRLAL